MECNLFWEVGILILLKAKYRFVMFYKTSFEYNFLYNKSIIMRVLIRELQRKHS